MLNINGNELDNKYDICNAFNNYFATLGDKLVEQLPASTPGSLTFNNYLTKVSKIAFFVLLLIKLKSVLLENLLNNKSPEPDSIGPVLVKLMKNLILDPLTYIFNLSLSTGLVPYRMKIAKVIPAFKKGDSDIPSNYRPISLLSIFDKLFGKIVCTRITNFLIHTL